MKIRNTIFIKKLFTVKGKILLEKLLFIKLLTEIDEVSHQHYSHLSIIITIIVSTTRLFIEAKLEWKEFYHSYVSYQDPSDMVIYQQNYYY